jgi:hypothetical protein
MRRYMMIAAAVMLTVLSAVWMTPMARAEAVALPASNWYAVIWLQNTDTLHWVNANGEQASIPRPVLPNQISQAQTRLAISPDGRYLVVISPLLNGREAIGFYDFALGKFVQAHEAEPDEVFLPSRKFTEFSDKFVVSLRNQITGAWRILVFQTATGNALAQMTHTDPMLLQAAGNIQGLTPAIAQFNADEAINTSEVRFRLVPQSNDNPYNNQSLLWTLSPAQQTIGVTPDTLSNVNPEAGFDIHPMTGEMLFAQFDTQLAPQPSPNASNTIKLRSGDSEQVIATEPSGSVSFPRWLNNGNWIGYWRQNGVLATHWMIVSRDGQTSLPISPNIIDVYHVSDGLLAKDSAAGRLDHLTNLNGEGFAEPAGNTIFHPKQPFAVIYTTPASTAFGLTTLAAPGNGIAAADDIVQPAAACGSAPAPRLSVGMTARVAFTDGTPLRLRDVPFGNIIAQIPEGTTFNVLAGPQCAQDYLWWNIQLNNGVVGWAAEGTAQSYFIEPVGNAAVNTPLAVQPTPMILVATLQPTATGMVIVAPPIVPSATPGMIINIPVTCLQSPSPQLAVGGFARTPLNPPGALALYADPNSDTPFANIPGNTGMRVIGGSVCRANGQRMWQVELTLQGQTVSGWAAEGFGQTYYLLPGLPRASD